MDPDRIRSTRGAAFSATAIVGIAAAAGVVASYPMWFGGLIAVGAVVALGLATEAWILAIMVLPLGLSFGFLADAPGAPTGSEAIDGLRLAIALGAFGVFAMRKPFILAPIGEVGLYVLFLAFSAATLLWSPGASDGIRLLCKLVYPLAVFLVARRVLQTEGEGRLVEMVRLAALLSVVLNVTVALLGVSPYIGVGYEERFGGASHPNTVGLFSAAVALILYAVWTQRGGRGNVAIAALMLAQLIATGSRTALVAGALGFIAIEVFQRRLRRVLAVLACGALIWMLVPTFGARTLDDPAGDVAADAFGVNLSGRMTLWMDVWSSLMGDSQALGRGLGTTESFFATRYASLRSVHNGYLLLLIDTGLVGIALMLAFFGLAALRLVSLVRSPGVLTAYPALALGVMAMFLLASVTEGTFGGYAYPALLWLSIALATYSGGAMARSAAPSPGSAA